MSPRSRRIASRCAAISTGFAAITAVAALAQAARAQPSVRPPLTLAAARAAARASSPDLLAAREAVAAAAGRERQASAVANPTLSYAREQTAGAGERASQDVFAFDQRLDLPGLRAARRDAARFRREAAEARLAALETQVDLDVAHAFARALAADRAAAVATEAARAFETAVAVTEKRLREGDVSGAAARRIRLEAARYAAARAEASLGRRNARLALGVLVATSAAEARVYDGDLADPIAAISFAAGETADSLVALAERMRPELRAADREYAAARAEARVTARERLPSVALVAGSKTEQSATGVRLGGFVAGASVPLALWDRRTGAIDAANAEARRRDAELEAARRRVAREVINAFDGVRAALEALAVLTPQRVADANAALRAAELAFAEGEMSLLEWLDTVRAWQETETSLARLHAEYLSRLAELEHAAGTPLPGMPR